jgi:dihydropteroate synthase
MGVVNTTPDSFSDGGRHLDPQSAIAAGRAMHEAGAAVVDVGGESTRPGAEPVSAEIEQVRILPVVRSLASLGVIVSVDTRNASTMVAALDAGARIVNDVSALTHDPCAAALLAARRCPVVLMHMRGTPATMVGERTYSEIPRDVARELAARIDVALSAGIGRDAIAVDPGIGFAKGLAENVALLQGLGAICALGFPVVIGASRKGFIGRLTGIADPAHRLGGSLAAELFALSRGAAMLRVHDVAETVQAIRVWRALTGLG